MELIGIEKGLGKEKYKEALNNAGGNIEILFQSVIISLYKSGKKEQADEMKAEFIKAKTDSMEEALANRTKEQIKDFLFVNELNLEVLQEKIKKIKEILGE